MALVGVGMVSHQRGTRDVNHDARGHEGASEVGSEE